MRLRSGADLAGPIEAADGHEATATSVTMDQESNSTDEFSSTAVEASTTRESLSIADSHHPSRSPAPAPEPSPTFPSPEDSTSEPPSRHERSFRRPHSHRPILPRPPFPPAPDPPANTLTGPSYPLSRYTHATEQAPFPSEDAESRKRRISEVSESGAKAGLQALAQPTERDKLGNELDEMGRLEEGPYQGVQKSEREKPRMRRSPRKRRRDDDGGRDAQGGDGQRGNGSGMGNGNGSGNGMADGSVNI